MVNIGKCFPQTISGKQGKHEKSEKYVSYTITQKIMEIPKKSILGKVGFYGRKKKSSLLIVMLVSFLSFFHQENVFESSYKIQKTIFTLSLF
jgi:hypothetical protein